MGMAILIGSAVASTVARAGDCAEVAQSQLKACRSNDLDDYWVAIARCDNDAAEDPQGLCPRAASQALTGAREDCGAQLDARLKICNQLGGRKYDPVIDPANFSTSTNINNPISPEAGNNAGV